VREGIMGIAAEGYLWSLDISPRRNRIKSKHPHAHGEGYGPKWSLWILDVG